MYSSQTTEQFSIDQMLQAINAALHGAPRVDVDREWEYNDCDNDRSPAFTALNDDKPTYDSWTPENRTTTRAMGLQTNKVPFQTPTRGHAPLWEQQAPYNTMTLPDVFKLLESEDPECVICVKKIHKLGFRSVKFLRQYFSQFGVITRIVVLPSRQKDIGSPYGTSVSTFRPASMCFIVMSSRLACRRILMQEMHFICDQWPVEVAVFDREASSSTRASSASSWETITTTESY